MSPSSDDPHSENRERTVVDTATHPDSPEGQESGGDVPEDDEYSATVMIQVPEGGPPPRDPGVSSPAHLRCIQGNDLGRIFPLEAVTTFVGRGINCNLILNDPSVSRQHFNIIKTAEGFKLIDLGSGNGTLVDGEKIREVALLDGAEIEVGLTKLRFSAKPAPAGLSADHPIAPPAPSPAPKAPAIPRMPPLPQKPPDPPAGPPPAPVVKNADPPPQSAGLSRGLKRGISVAVAVVLLGGVFILGDRLAGLGIIFPLEGPEVGERLATAEDLFHEGLERLEENRFARALLLLEQAERHDPTLPGLGAALRLARTQAEAEDDYDAALDALQMGDRAEAMALLAIIPEEAAIYGEASRKIEELRGQDSPHESAAMGSEPGAHAIRLFEAQDFEAAEEAFRDAAAAAADPREKSFLEAGARAVGEFVAPFQAAIEARSRGRHLLAVDHLDEAIRIGGFLGSRLDTDLRASAAESLVILARRELNEGQAATAARHIKRAFSYDETSQEAVILRGRLAERVEEIMLAGREHMAAGESEAALATFRAAGWLISDDHRHRSEIDTYIEVLSAQ